MRADSIFTQGTQDSRLRFSLIHGSAAVKR
jgi:hypothetical protein